MGKKKRFHAKKEGEQKKRNWAQPKEPSRVYKKHKQLVGESGKKATGADGGGINHPLGLVTKKREGYGGGDSTTDDGGLHLG